MPQSLSNVLVHLAFSTKGRRALLRPDELRAEMHKYLGGVSNKLVAVSQSQCSRVGRYTAAQEEHPRRRSFQEEFRELLRKHGIQFEER